jgi:hypothetical protein
LEEIPKDAHRAFEKHYRVDDEHREAAKARDLQEFLACLKKDQHGTITHIKQVIIQSVNDKTKVRYNVNTSSLSVTYKNISSMFAYHNKNTINQIQ